VFENSIWLFFTHPFDVGDVINYEGSRYTVRHIKMQFVILERVDGACVTVPTSEMTTARVHNITRCVLTICIDVITWRNELVTYCVTLDSRCAAIVDVCGVHTRTAKHTAQTNWHRPILCTVR
jgi:small-conductance mechanosensitive channel